MKTVLLEIFSPIISYIQGFKIFRYPDRFAQNIVNERYGIKELTKITLGALIISISIESINSFLFENEVKVFAYIQIPFLSELLFVAINYVLTYFLAVSLNKLMIPNIKYEKIFLYTFLAVTTVSMLLSPITNFFNSLLRLIFSIDSSTPIALMVLTQTMAIAYLIIYAIFMARILDKIYGIKRNKVFVKLLLAFFITIIISAIIGAILGFVIGSVSRFMNTDSDKVGIEMMVEPKTVKTPLGKVIVSGSPTPKTANITSQSVPDYQSSKGYGINWPQNDYWSSRPEIAKKINADLVIMYKSSWEGFTPNVNVLIESTNIDSIQQYLSLSGVQLENVGFTIISSEFDKESNAGVLVSEGFSSGYEIYTIQRIIINKNKVFVVTAADTKETKDDPKARQGLKHIINSFRIINTK